MKVKKPKEVKKCLQHRVASEEGYVVEEKCRQHQADSGMFSGLVHKRSCDYAFKAPSPR